MEAKWKLSFLVFFFGFSRLRFFSWFLPFFVRLSAPELRRVLIVFFPGRCCQGKVKGTATFIIGEDIGPLFPRAAGALARGQANFGAARVPILNWLTSTEEVFCSKC